MYNKVSLFKGFYKMENVISDTSYLINLLRNDGNILVNKKLAHSIGLNEAIMYSELLAKYKYFAEKKELNDDGYFFNTVVNMKKDTTLSDHQQRKAICSLERLGLIKYKTKGLPAKRFFKIIENEENIKKYLTDSSESQLLKKLKTGSLDSSELDIKKLQSNNTNVNNPNSNNTKVNVNGFSSENLPSKKSNAKNKNERNAKKINDILSLLSNSDDRNEYQRILYYYLNKYAKVFKEYHPELKAEYWERVINDLFINPVSAMVDKDIDVYEVLIDSYFETEFVKGCDYNILHFATSGIIDNRYWETSY